MERQETGLGTYLGENFNNSEFRQSNLMVVRIAIISN